MSISLPLQHIAEQLAAALRARLALIVSLALGSLVAVLVALAGRRVARGG